MKHSVVIPLYNKGPYIRRTLESITSQKKLPDELIIVDDASTDNSVEIATEYLAERSDIFSGIRTEIIRLEKNQGPGHARNTGFEKTTGELISFLDADDIYLPGCLQVVNDEMEKNGIDFLVLSIRMVPSRIQYPEIYALKKGLKKITGQAYLLTSPLHTVTSPDFVMGLGSNVVVKRKWMENIHYHTTASLNEGIDYWYRVLKNMVQHPGTKTGLLMGNYLEVHETEGSLSRKKPGKWKEICLPPSIDRYKKSKDLYDRRLMKMIGERWFGYAMENLTSKRQKLLFIFHYRNLLVKYTRFSLHQKISPSKYV